MLPPSVGDREGKAGVVTSLEVGHAAAARPRPSDSPSFDRTFRSIADVDGWMTRAQAVRLWDRASTLGPDGVIVEIGSFRGRSAIVLATSAPAGVAIFTIDPHGGNDRGPHEFEGYEAEAESDHQLFLANLERAGVRSRITHLRTYSSEAIDDVPAEIDLLYIDGAHRYAPARDDLVRYRGRVAYGGTLLVHDSFSALGLTAALFQVMSLSGTFRYVGRSGSMAEYQRVDLTPADRAANLFRQLLELPYFARNLTIKALIKAKLAPLTRLLGGDGTWPY
jgi:hypothetical protein